jgi:hypothetical protein
MGVDVCALFQM